MEINDIRKLQHLLETATDSINEALALASQPEGYEPRKRKIYVTQQRLKGSERNYGWQTLFADLDHDTAYAWADSHNEENADSLIEYRVKEIDLYLD